MEARRVALQSRSPQRPDDLVVEVEEADAVAVDQAVGLARKAAGGWAAASALERSAALVAAADALAGAAGEVTDLMVREVGKPVAEAAAEVALRLAELLAPALPNDVFQVVPGGAETGRAMLERVDCMSFTGSVAVGHQVAVAATGRGIPSQAEMGGLNATIVLSDADPERAATVVAGAAMGYAGQKCTATSRAIVVGDPGPFTEALVTAVQGLAVGDPAEEGTVVGPVITDQARRRVVEAAQEAVAAGGRLLTGGKAA